MNNSKSALQIQSQTPFLNSLAASTPKQLPKLQQEKISQHIKLQNTTSFVALQNQQLRPIKNLPPSQFEKSINQIQMPTSDVLSQRKVFHIVQKTTKLKKDNLKFMQKIGDILSDNKFERNMEHRQFQFDRYKRAVSQRQNQLRTQKICQISYENKRLKNRLRDQKSDYQSGILNTTRGCHELSQSKLPFIQQKVSTTPRAILISREKSQNSNTFIERQATKLLSDNREVLFKKTQEIPILNSIKISESAIQYKLDNQFIVEVSKAKNLINISAFDLFSDQNYLTQLTEKQFQNLLSYQGNITSILQLLYLKDGNLRLKQLNGKISRRKSNQSSKHQTPQACFSLERRSFLFDSIAEQQKLEDPQEPKLTNNDI